MTTVYGVMGYPVHHSKSPAMHNAGFRALGIDAVYGRFEVSPAHLREAIDGLRALHIGGANVTLPHKKAVIPLLDEVNDDAVAIGAVNTIVNDGGRLFGLNTDAPGLVRSLEVAGVPMSDARVVLLGAGGAARAAVVGLARAGAESVVVAARRVESAEALVQDLGRPLASSECELSATGLDKLGAHFSNATLVVQATSATLAGSPSAQPFADALPLDAMNKDAWVTDLVYAPRETTVLKAASQLGLKTVDGLGMLLYQGVLAFEQWTNVAAPVNAMRDALEAGLASRVSQE